jgi:hypothetical protein
MLLQALKFTVCLGLFRGIQSSMLRGCLEFFGLHAKAFAPTKYIWFDLFCIQQDRSPLALFETSCQASYIRHRFVSGVMAKHYH